MALYQIFQVFFTDSLRGVRKGVFLTLFVFFFTVTLLPGAASAGMACGSGKGRPCRIVSLSPGVTETLFALGLGHKVVGVTRFCSYPPEACERPGVGGYIDPNYEAIASLTPDVVVLLPEQRDMKKNLAILGIETITVDSKTVEDIFLTIDTLGRAFGASLKAKTLTRELQTRVEAIRGRASGLPRPAVLISVARGMGSIGIKTVYIAGRGGYFDELLDIVGGLNVYRDERIKFPRISWEGLLGMNPDIILDLVPSMKKNGWNEEEILSEWKAMEGLKAVEEKRVYVFGEDYVTIPGPRFILLLEDMAEAIHPGLKRAGELRP